MMQMITFDIKTVIKYKLFDSINNNDYHLFIIIHFEQNKTRAQHCALHSAPKEN